MLQKRPAAKNQNTKANRPRYRLQLGSWLCWRWDLCKTAISSLMALSKVRLPSSSPDTQSRTVLMLNIKLLFRNISWCESGDDEAAYPESRVSVNFENKSSAFVGYNLPNSRSVLRQLFKIMQNGLYGCVLKSVRGQERRKHVNVPGKMLLGEFRQRVDEA